MTEINSIQNLISERERKYLAAEAEQIQRRTKLAAEAAAQAAAEASLLAPEREAIAMKRGQLAALVLKRDALLGNIKTAKYHLDQQQGFCAEIDAVCKSILLQTPPDGKNPNTHDFRNYFDAYPHLKVAPLIVEKIKAILSDFESDLESTESDIRSLN